MRQLTIANRRISDDSPPFIIAEIGHNHGGSLAKCKQLFKAAKDAGCDAVKLQKRDNRTLFTKTAYNRPYDNPNSYGATYGEHREALEFGEREYRELKEYARELDITFFATAFDIPSVHFLAGLDMPAFKVASADLLNFPLLSVMIPYGKPLIISTGGNDADNIEKSWMFLQEMGAKEVALLHCIASYPNEPDEINLRAIQYLRRDYYRTVIGWSDHYSGILAALGAYMNGAQIIEKHFTLRRTDKGTDHALSLEPKKMAELVNDLRILHRMKGDGIKRILPAEVEPIRKMAKSVYFAHRMEAGDMVSGDDLIIRSPGGGLLPCDADKVIGLTLTEGCSTGVPVTETMFKDGRPY